MVVVSYNKNDNDKMIIVKSRDVPSVLPLPYIPQPVPLRIIYLL